METDVLNRLYDTYSKELFLYLYSLCKDYQLAEDLLQETFVKAMLSLPRDHCNIRAWLYMVGRNMYFNHYKKEKKRLPVDDISEIADESIGSSWEELADNLIAGENTKLLYLAMANLPRDKREILQMQYFGELSQREIAAILHLTPENVRVMAYRAKHELRKYMEVHGYEIS